MYSNWTLSTVTSIYASWNNAWSYNKNFTRIKVAAFCLYTIAPFFLSNLMRNPLQYFGRLDTCWDELKKSARYNSHAIQYHLIKPHKFGLDSTVIVQRINMFYEELCVIYKVPSAIDINTNSVE